MQPVRILRSRQSKQVSPNGLPIVYVGRPGKWGNPFKISGDMIFGDASHRRKIFSPFVYISLANYYPPEKTLNEIVVDLYERWLLGMDGSYLIKPPTEDEIKEHLKGKNLSCWCRPDQACHADVLLKIANQ